MLISHHIFRICHSIFPGAGVGADCWLLAADGGPSIKCRGYCSIPSGREKKPGRDNEKAYVGNCVDNEFAFLLINIHRRMCFFVIV